MGSGGNGEAVRTRDPDRRDRILRAAVDLLAERGHHGVSMADIGVQEWVHVLLELRPELADGVARTKVHAAIGAVQSVGNHDSGLPRDEVVELLTEAACACSGVPC